MSTLEENQEAMVRKEFSSQTDKKEEKARSPKEAQTEPPKKRTLFRCSVPRTPPARRQRISGDPDRIRGPEAGRPEAARNARSVPQAARRRRGPREGRWRPRALTVRSVLHSRVRRQSGLRMRDRSRIVPEATGKEARMNGIRATVREITATGIRMTGSRTVPGARATGDREATATGIRVTVREITATEARATEVREAMGTEIRVTVPEAMGTETRVTELREALETDPREEGPDFPARAVRKEATIGRADLTAAGAGAGMTETGSRRVRSWIWALRNRPETHPTARKRDKNKDSLRENKFASDRRGGGNRPNQGRRPNQNLPKALQKPVHKQRKRRKRKSRRLPFRRS